LRQEIEIGIRRQQLSHLADEERMAVSPRIDPVDEFLSGGDIAGNGDELANLFPRQAVEANLMEPLNSRQLRQGAGEGLGRCPVAASCRGDDLPPRIGECARDKTQEQQRRVVCRVDVLQNEHDGLAASFFAQQGGDGIEEPKAQAFCVGGDWARQIGAELTQLRDYLGDVCGAGPELGGEHPGLRFAYQDPQALNPWPICRSTARFPAAAGQHPSISLGDACNEVLSKGSLADSGLATDQEQRAMAPLYVVQTASKVYEFAVAAYESTGWRDHIRSTDRRSRPVEAGLLPEYPAGERAKLRIRFDAELVYQAFA
jgi:hypothetical protein